MPKGKLEPDAHASFVPRYGDLADAGFFNLALRQSGVLPDAVAITLKNRPTLLQPAGHGIYSDVFEYDLEYHQSRFNARRAYDLPSKMVAKFYPRKEPHNAAELLQAFISEINGYHRMGDDLMHRCAALHPAGADRARAQGGPGR